MIRHQPRNGEIGILTYIDTDKGRKRCKHWLF